jgi:hypothetical protein
MTTEQSISAPTLPFGDYLVYVDESGDHGLLRCDSDYPVFVLAFCIIKKDAYAVRLAPDLLRLKFKHFGHGLAVLHEHEIRKAIGDFAWLKNAVRRTEFLNDLNTFIKDAPITVVAVVIRKEQLKRQYVTPGNPYHLALEYGLERVARFLKQNGQQGKLTHVICEARGHKEDDSLELEFRRIAASIPGFEIKFADKKANLPGLQIADLVARPIGRHVLNPQQANRAFEILAPKIRCGPNKKMEGYGLKVFP